MNFFVLFSFVKNSKAKQNASLTSASVAKHSPSEVQPQGSKYWLKSTSDRSVHLQDLK